MSREELLLKKRDEVVSIAKDLGITLSSNNKRKTKEQLVDEILLKGTSSDAEQNPVETEVVVEDEDWQQPNEEPTVEETPVESETEEVSLTDEEKEAKRRAYVENVKIGTLVAFKNGYNNKAKSAKVIKRSTKNRKLKVETKYGAEFIISYDDVIWVRTNKRWPKGVYQLLKGVVNDGQE